MIGEVEMRARTIVRQCTPILRRKGPRAWMRELLVHLEEVVNAIVGLEGEGEACHH